LIASADRFNLIILEDTPYREIRFEGESLPTLKSLDTEGRVHLPWHIFGKRSGTGRCAPGWTVANPAITHQLGCSNPPQIPNVARLNMKIISLFSEQNDIEAHIGQLRDAYPRKCHLMLHTIGSIVP
jgi:DNA-binding transcriptional MocR family regulator